MHRRLRFTAVAKLFSVVVSTVVSVVVSSEGFAAIRPADHPTPVQLGVAEILAMPTENRLAVAQARKELLLKDLEAWAFNRKKDFGDRWKAVVLYAQLSGAAAKNFLDRAIKAEEWFMRNAGLVAYQEVLPQLAPQAARKLLGDKALVVRSAAIQVLENHMDSEVRELLWEEIDQPRNFRKKQGLWTRSQILQILAREPKDRELELFSGYLRESDPRMQAPAMQGLEKLTRQTLGHGNAPLAQRRELWLKWVAKNENAQKL